MARRLKRVDIVMEKEEWSIMFKEKDTIILHNVTNCIMKLKSRFVKPAATDK